MASLREIKERINSVKSTLQITSAMKLLSSAKLHKVSTMIEPLKAYETELEKMLRVVGSSNIETPIKSASTKPCVVAFSSNTSLCGGFNANIIKKTHEVLSLSGKDTACYFIGKKISDAMSKEGFHSIKQLDSLIEHPDCKIAYNLADELINGFTAGTFSSVKLVYNHFLSTSKQIPTVEDYLPIDILHEKTDTEDNVEDLFILEPDINFIRTSLISELMHLRLYEVLLDSCLSEHSARTVAMQTATDNGQSMLDDLTLEYNKGRQAKITSEILDLAGGAQQ